MIAFVVLGLGRCGCISHLGVLGKDMWNFLAGVLVMVAASSKILAAAVPQVSNFEVQDAEHRATVLRIEERNTQVGLDSLQERQYRSRKNDPAGFESVRLRGEAQQLVSYVFEDLGSGERIDLKVDGNKASVQYRPSKDAEVKSKDLSWGENALTGSLLPGFIAKQWATLDAGRTVDFELFVPFRMETIGFRLLRTATNSEDKTVTITAEASNWLIRQFAPAISFVFSSGVPPRLLKYQGPAPVQIDGEQIKAVEIDFSKARLTAQVTP